MDSNNPRLEAVETKLAFQEDALQQLNDVLVAQQVRLDRLEALINVLTERLREQGEQGAGTDDQPPPHY